MARSTENLFGRKYSLIIGLPRGDLNTAGTGLPIPTAIRRGEGSIEEIVGQNNPAQPIIREQSFIEIKDLQIKATLIQGKRDSGKFTKTNTIDIYNLSRDTIDKLRAGMIVLFTAGYTQDIELASVFTGEIEKVITDRQGANTITRLYCGDNTTARRDVRVSMAWSEGTSYDQVLTDLLSFAQVNNVTLGRPEIPEGMGIAIGNKFLEAGYTVQGNLFDVIKKVAKECQYVSYFCDGKFYVEPEVAPHIVEVFRIEEDNVKEFIKPKQNVNKNTKEVSQGINLKLFLDGRVKVNSKLELPSGPKAGTYIVKKVTHYLDYEGSWWETELEADIQI